MPTRPPLSRERVLRAAIAFVEEHGLEALSMRKLAQELGVEAMSLYNHVANKNDILHGMVELVAAEIEPAAEGAEWKSALRASAVSVHETLTRHPWAARMWTSRSGPSEIGMRYADAVLRAFREAGFTKELTYHAYHTLEGYVYGFTLQELNFAFDPAKVKEMAASFLRDFPKDEYPYLAEHVAQHVEPRRRRGRAFELGLDLILDGLERMRDARASKPARGRSGRSSSR